MNFSDIVMMMMIIIYWMIVFFLNLGAFFSLSSVFLNPEFLQKKRKKEKFPPRATNISQCGDEKNWNNEMKKNQSFIPMFHKKKIHSKQQQDDDDWWSIFSSEFIQYEMKIVFFIFTYLLAYWTSIVQRILQFFLFFCLFKSIIYLFGSRLICSFFSFSILSNFNS